MGQPVAKHGDMLTVTQCCGRYCIDPVNHFSQHFVEWLERFSLDKVINEHANE